MSKAIRSARSTASLTGGENQTLSGAGESHRSLCGQLRPSLGDITNVPTGNASKVAGIPKPIKVVASALPPTSCNTTTTIGKPPSSGDVAASPSSILDVDQADANNPQSVAEYVSDVYGNLRQDEGNYVARADYMDEQGEINAKMRAILVDWLVEVHMKYKLKNETLFLAVNIIDRFLEKKRVARRRLQLVGVTGMLIAAKFEEIYPPEIRDFVYICDKAYTKEDILNCEIAMLTTLEFNLRVPTAVHFLDRFAKLNGCSEVQRQLSQYIVELTLPDIKMIRYTPSHLASAAIYLTNKLLKQQPAWSPTMVKHAKHQEQTIKGCAKEMCTHLEVARGNPSQLQAVCKKFSQPKYHCVAKMSF